MYDLYTYAPNMNLKQALFALEASRINNVFHPVM